jgi:hypothetical protein
MLTLKRWKTTCILAGATTVLLATGCHSSSSTTTASAKSQQQIAKTTPSQQKSAQTSAQVARSTPPANVQTYDNYWDNTAPDTTEFQPAPAAPAKPAPAPAPARPVAAAPAPAPVQPTYTAPAQPAPQPVAQAPAPAPVQPTYTAPATPAPQPVAQAPAPAPRPVAQNTPPTDASSETPRYFDENDAQVSDAEVTETDRLMHTQECAGARAEATLYPEQFDGPGLTSLGTHALDLMLQDSHSCSPLVLYLDIPDDAIAEDRRLAIGRYLEDRGGLKPEQIEFHYGTNPDNYHSADVQLGYYLAKTDTAADTGGQSGVSSSSASSNTNAGH